MGVTELIRNVGNDVFSPSSVLAILSIKAWSYDTETLLNLFRSNLAEGHHLALHGNLAMFRENI